MLNLTSLSVSKIMILQFKFFSGLGNYNSAFANNKIYMKGMLFKMVKPISTQALQRLPLYLSYLRSLPSDSAANISAKVIADNLSLGEVQVRKDLASISNGGKPKIGYMVEELIRDLEQFLGYDNTENAVLVGAGQLGKALLSYSRFKSYGLDIVAAFDIDDSVVGKTQQEKPILPLSKFSDLCRRMKVRIGIITVPAECAQSVCDMMIENGIMAVWNFAPTHLKVTENILVQNENMASSLALLSNHLAEQIHTHS